MNPSSLMAFQNIRKLSDMYETKCPPFFNARIRVIPKNNTKTYENKVILIHRKVVSPFLFLLICSCYFFAKRICIRNSEFSRRSSLIQKRTDRPTRTKTDRPTKTDQNGLKRTETDQSAPKQTKIGQNGNEATLSGCEQPATKLREISRTDSSLSSHKIAKTERLKPQRYTRRARLLSGAFTVTSSNASSRRLPKHA